MDLVVTSIRAFGDSEKLLNLELWFNENIYVLIENSGSNQSMFHSPYPEDAEDRFFEMYYSQLQDYISYQKEFPLGLTLQNGIFDKFSYKPPELLEPPQVQIHSTYPDLDKWSESELEMIEEIHSDIWLVNHSQLGNLCYKKVSRRGVEHEVVREIDTLKALDDLKSISHLIGLATNTQGNICGLLLEYIEGHTLENLNQRGSLTQSQRELIFHQLLQIVDQVHDRGYHHGDIKPSNIMVTPDLEVKLIDWGGGITRYYNPNYDSSPSSDYQALEIIKKEMDI